MPRPELIEDAVIGLYGQLAFFRETLSRRYDDVESGRVKLIPGQARFTRSRRVKVCSERESGSCKSRLVTMPAERHAQRAPASNKTPLACARGSVIVPRFRAANA